jgi:soluble lytic murein transglycosylase
MSRRWKGSWTLVLALFLAADAGLAAWWYFNRREHSQDGPIFNAAKRYGVDPALVKAVVWRESRFNHLARGKAGEIGLMQIRETAALEWAESERIWPFAHEQLVDPTTNTLAGTWYLAKLIKRYPHADNPLPYALADYNAGRANVLRWNKGGAATNSALFLAQMDYPMTRRYIEAVERRYGHYRSDK